MHKISDLDQSRLTDARSAENDRIGADTEPEYLPIYYASLLKELIYSQTIKECSLTWHPSLDGERPAQLNG